MAVSRSPAGTVRTRPASVDSRGRERESRGAATKGARQKKADGRLWCGCISRPFALSSPSFGKRSSANAKSDSKSSSKGVNGREAGVKASLDCRPGESNLMKSNDRSTISENVACRTTLLGGETTASNSNKATPGVMVEVKAGESLIARKFSSLAEGLELRPISPFRPRLSPGKVSPLLDQQQQQSVAGDSGGNSPTVMPQPPCTSYSKLGSTNSSLGSSPPVDRAKSSPSPTLFEMMAHEQDVAAAKPFLVNAASQNSSLDLSSVPLSTSTMQPSLHDKVRGILGGSSPGNQFNDSSSSDLKLTLSSRDGYSATVSVHRHILVSNSRFFAAKLSDRWSKQQRSLPHLVEISDCDDVELYLETLRLMYCCDLKRTLMKETVVRVLGILKVSAAIVFEAGVASCLEFLEAVPWDQEEEEKINVVLSQLQLETFGANEVLKRCAAVEASNSEDILVRLLNSVTQGTDEKARREMKALVSRMLRENVSQNKVHFDLSKESLYKVCHRCMDAILHLYMQATSTDFVSKNSEDRVALFSQIARQADNLHWLVDILIDRRIADDLVRLWAHQSELATLHMQVPTMYRYEVSRLTARFCIAIGKGQVVSPKDVRYMLLQTWLQPLVEDFGWIQRCCKVLDKKVVEEGISQTILTLPLKQQQTILLAWFDRFSNSGDDCPNLQKAFEVWWRRIFLKPTSFDEDGLVLEPQIP